VITLTDIFNALDEVGAGFSIQVNPYLDVCTLEMDGECEVFVNPEHSDTTAALLTKLAHEYGHCSTGSFHKVESPYQLIAKHEYKADRCAIEKFLPWAEIKKAVSTGLTEYWQLAEYFNVNEEFIKKAVHYYRNIKQYSFDDIA